MIYCNYRQFDSAYNDFRYHALTLTYILPSRLICLSNANDLVTLNKNEREGDDVTDSWVTRKCSEILSSQSTGSIINMALKGFTKLCIAKNFKQKQRIFRFSFSPSENVKEPLLISFTRVFCLESNTVCLNYVYFISLIKSQTRNPHINQSTASRTIVCGYHRLYTNEHVT